MNTAALKVVSSDTPAAPAAPTAYDIQQQITVLERERMTIPKFDLPHLEDRIQFHAARTQVGSLEQIATHKADLLMYIGMKEAAEQHLARITEINQQVARLNQDLLMARDLEKWQQAGDATKLCQQAWQDYVSASKATARAFRRLIATNRHASAFPGAVPSPIDARMHLPAIYPMEWNGTVGQSMLDGLLPFETRELREQQQ